eukprot:scaffold81927_cov31-Phaeocystis_antarctica.AAC.2
MKAAGVSSALAPPPGIGSKVPLAIGSLEYWARRPRGTSARTAPAPTSTCCPGGRWSAMPLLVSA